MKNSIFKTKSIDTMIFQSSQKNELKRNLGAFHLSMLGVGAIMGSGIFVLTGIATAEYAGPSLIVSFILSALACIFTALCYAEFAAMIPVAGSSYVYSYASLGEIWAWLVGWLTILQYIASICLVALGWSGYIINFLNSLGLHLSSAFVNSPGINGGIVNLPAIFIILVITFVNILGVEGSTKINNIMVFIKLAVVFIFIFLGAFHINTANWRPFMPFGWNGVFKGASVVFFAFLGFDSVSTAAEEVKNPQTDLPKGIIFSLVICAILYIGVCAVLTGTVPYYELKGVAAPLSYALVKMGFGFGNYLISFGILCGLTSVLLVLIFAQSRILFSMSRDGLLPKFFKQVNKKNQTPSKSIITIGIISSLIAGFMPMNSAAELANLGTLSIFIMVSASIIVLRYKNPKIKRIFKCPLVPFVPLLSISFCLYLICMIPSTSKFKFAIWILLGIFIYFFYSKKNSKLQQSTIF